MCSNFRRLSFTRTAKQIISEGGIIGLWRGGLPSVQRAALVNMGELTTYDTSKRWFAVRFQLEVSCVEDPFISFYLFRRIYLKFSSVRQFNRYCTLICGSSTMDSFALFYNTKKNLRVSTHAFSQS